MARIDAPPLDPQGDSWIAEHVRLYVSSGGRGTSGSLAYIY